LNILEKVIKRFKDGIFLNALYQRMGIGKKCLIPYYLVQEGFFGDGVRSVEPRLSPLEICELGPSDISILAANGERDHSEEEMLKMLSKGCVCLGIKYKDEIAA
jgi:hypothetical protein